MSFICDHCGYTYNDDEINHFDGQELCDECYEEETVVCEHCGERVWTFYAQLFKIGIGH